MKTKLDYLFSCEAPWVHLTHGEPEIEKWYPSYFYSREGVNSCVRLLRGNRMTEFQGMFNEISATFQFPWRYGENWPGLRDCLRSIDEWIPADCYIAAFQNSEDILLHEGEGDKISFLSTFDIIGKFWSESVVGNGAYDRPAIPFHAIFLFSDGHEEELRYFDNICRTNGIQVSSDLS